MTWIVVVLLVVIALAALAGAIFRREWRAPLLEVAALAVAVMLIAVGIGVTHKPAIGPLDPNPDAKFKLLAMGDSYISGEGAREFFPGTDDSRNGCRRAPTAYPYLVAADMDLSLKFVACSGAETGDVTAAGQFPNSSPGVIGNLPQIDYLKNHHYDAVILSIGGNDAGFGEIGKACAFPGKTDCRASAQAWLNRLDKTVFDALRATYRSVVSAAGSGTPVFVMDYPNPLGTGRDCLAPLGFSQGEFGFVRDVFVPHLDSIVKLAASLERVRVIDIEHALDGKRICDVPFGQSDMNVVALGRTRGKRLHLFKDITGLGHDTFHPNERGHRDIEKVVRASLQQLEDHALPALPPAPPDGTRPTPVDPTGKGAARGPYPFPAGTGCAGAQLTEVVALTTDASVETVDVPGVAPHSKVCYRAFEDKWRSVRADASGLATVPVNVGNPGVASTNEILTMHADGSWSKTVVLGDNSVGRPEKKSFRWLLWLGGLVVLAIIVQRIVRWVRRARTAQPETEGSLNE